MATALEGDEGSASRPGRSLPRERPGTHCTGGWMGPRSGLDKCGKSVPPPGFDPRTVQHVTSRYTDWGIVTQYKVKVKQFNYRPGQALRVPGVWDSHVSRESAQEGGKVVSPTRRSPLHPKEKAPILIFVRVWDETRAIVRPEGLCQWKIPMTPSGI